MNIFPFNLFSKNSSFFYPLLPVWERCLLFCPSLSHFCVPLGNIVPRFHLSRGYGILWVCLQASCLDSSFYYCYSTAQMSWWMLGTSMRLATSLGSDSMVHCGLGYPQNNLRFLILPPHSWHVPEEMSSGLLFRNSSPLRWLVTSPLISPSQRVDFISFC